MSSRAPWVAVVLAALAWRAARWALGFPLFGDEAFVAVNLQLASLGELLGRRLEYDMVLPPGYLLAEWGSTQLFGLGERALRLPALLAGLAGTLLLPLRPPGRLGRRG